MVSQVQILSELQVLTQLKQAKEQEVKKTQEAQDYEAAYWIALKIVKNGVRAQPYLYPAYRDNQQGLINSLDAIKI